MSNISDNHRFYWWSWWKKVILTACSINAVLILALTISGEAKLFLPASFFDGWIKRFYCNVPCLPPCALNGTWIIDSPHSPSVILGGNAVDETKRGWKDVKLILKKDGTFYFKPIPLYVTIYPNGWNQEEHEAYCKSGRDKEASKLTPLKGK